MQQPGRPTLPAPLLEFMYSVTLKSVTFSYMRNTHNLQASPSRAGTTVTLGVHNIAFFFVLASRTGKTTLIPLKKMKLWNMEHIWALSTLRPISSG